MFPFTAQVYASHSIKFIVFDVELFIERFSVSVCGHPVTESTLTSMYVPSAV